MSSNLIHIPLDRLGKSNGIQLMNAGEEERGAETTTPQEYSSFPPTSLTDLLQSQGDDEEAQTALESLCRAYWNPLYSHLRYRGHSIQDAQDIAQGFFLKLISGKRFADFVPGKGKLRSYLLGALKHFESNWERDRNAMKRGGSYRHISFDYLEAEKLFGAEPNNADSPDVLFDRQWAMTLISRVQDELRAHYENEGKQDAFEALKNFIDGNHPDEPLSKAAHQLGRSLGATKMVLQRMRDKRRRILRSQIAMTVGSRNLIDEEIAYLISLFREIGI